MSLHSFIQALHGAEGGLHVEEILDALWLATRGRTLTLHGEPAPVTAPPEPQPPPSVEEEDEEQQRRQERPERKEKPAPEDSDVPGKSPPAQKDDSKRKEEPQEVFPRGDTKPDEKTVKASPVAVPAGYGLTKRLKFSRALRPFLKRYPSAGHQQLDEEKTALAIAENLGRPQLVFRGAQEPWFDAEVVVEDDPALGAWRDPLRDFTQLLRETGAFRQVHFWRLRTPPLPAPASTTEQPVRDRKRVDDNAFIESAGGVRIRPAAIAGRGVRRLIFFANHGASDHWLDGRYARILGLWGRSACLVSLYLLPRSQWARGALGEPAGLCQAPEAGAPASVLIAQPFWWSRIDGAEALTRVPAIPLTPHALNEFALMQMGRARRSTIYLLRSHWPPIPAPAQAPVDEELALALLGESSPAAYQLAIYLCANAFTIPVARLIHETMLGGSVIEPDHLGQIMLSGLLEAHTPPHATSDPDELYYEFREGARKILIRSLREADAKSIAGILEQRVSEYLQKITGRGISFRGLVPDDNGKYDLPAWAQPFARMSLTLLGKPLPDIGASANLVNRFRATQSAFSVGEAAFAAARWALNQDLNPDSVDPAVWPEMVKAGLVRQEPNAPWSFVPGVEALLRELAEQEPLHGVDVGWVAIGGELPGTVFSKLKSLGAMIWVLDENQLHALDIRTRRILVAGDMDSGRTLSRTVRGVLSLASPPSPMIMFDSSATSLAVRLLAYEMGFTGCSSSEREIVELVREAAGRAVLLSGRMQRALEVRAKVEAAGLTLPVSDALLWQSAESIAQGLIAVYGGAGDEAVFAKLIEVIRVYSGATVVELFKRDGDRLLIVAAAVPPSMPSPVGYAALERGLVPSAARESGVAWAPDISKEAEYARVYTTTRSELAVAVLESDAGMIRQVVGVLNVEMDRLDGLSIGEIQWLERLCAPLAHRLKAFPGTARRDRELSETAPNWLTGKLRDLAEQGPAPLALKMAKALQATLRIAELLLPLIPLSKDLYKEPDHEYELARQALDLWSGLIYGETGSWDWVTALPKKMRALARTPDPNGSPREEAGISLFNAILIVTSALDPGKGGVLSETDWISSETAFEKAVAAGQASGTINRNAPDTVLRIVEQEEATDGLYRVSSQFLVTYAK